MEINVQQFLLQIVNFGILFAVLSYFVYRPILKILDERAKKINDGINAAERSLQDQMKMEETKKKEMAKTQKESARILEEAQKQAALLSKEIVDQAKEEAKKAVLSEEKQLMARIQKEEQRLKTEFATLVTQTSQSVLKDSLDGKMQKEIISNQIKQLKKLKV